MWGCVYGLQITREVNMQVAVGGKIAASGATHKQLQHACYHYRTDV
jgi:hypothetical protein